jgi:hypothetical protein
MFSDKVVEEANAGSLMLVYMGHGSYDRLDNMHVGKTRYPILLGEDVTKFNIEDGKLPVMLIVACQTGYMDHPQGSLCERVCFQEKAPVAIIASSRDSHPYSNTLLQKALVGEITEHRRATLGEAFLRAKRELILAEDPARAELETLASLVIPKKANREALNQSHVSLYNLTGDPGLQLRYPDIDLAPEDARFDAKTGKVAFGAALPKGTGKLAWECTVEVTRSQIPGELKPVTADDLASGDEKKIKAAEEAIAANHAISNTKQVATIKCVSIGSSTEADAEFVVEHFEGKPDPALAPGDYILKLSARDKDGKKYGFTALRLTIQE